MLELFTFVNFLLKSEIEKCFDVGMNDYIPKPYKPEQLITKLLEYKSK